MNMSLVRDAVIGLDGSPESTVALRWLATQMPSGGCVHAVHAVHPVDALARDAVLGDSVGDLHRRERELIDEWLAPLAGSAIDVRHELREGDAPDVLLEVAAEVEADAVVVGHHPHARLGPQLVGHVTRELLRHSPVPVVIVPSSWEPVDEDAPVVVGVGVSSGTRAAIAWALEHADLGAGGLSLVHAFGRRSMFRQGGFLDLIAYHLDPSVLSDWVESDLTELAEQMSRESGRDAVELSVSVTSGRTGAVLAEAGRGARLLVIGRGEPPFVRRHAIAPYLRHALLNATCPIAVVPAAEACG